MDDYPYSADLLDAAPLDGDDDFFDVLKEVLPVAAKWKAVGQALRLKLGELDSIAASHPHSVEECLSEMLTQWLRRNYNVKKFGEPSWQRLVEAVGDPAGGANPALANQIAGKHRAKQATSIVHRRRHSFSTSAEGAFPIAAGHGYRGVFEPDDYVQDIMPPPVPLTRKYLWYHGKTSREDSEELLKDAPDGYFLVRESTTQPGNYALSTKHQGEIRHWFIRFREDRYTYEITGTGKCFQRITELVGYYQEHFITTEGEILTVSCPRNLEFQSQTPGDFDNHKRDNSPGPGRYRLPPVPPHSDDHELEPPAVITSIYSVPAVSPPPPVPPRQPVSPVVSPATSPPPVPLRQPVSPVVSPATSPPPVPLRQPVLPNVLDKMQTSKIVTGTAESSEKFTCSTSGEGIKRAEVKSTASFKLCVIPSTQKSIANLTIEAELKHVVHHSVIGCTITHKGEQEYEVAYKPEIRGRYALSLKIDSHEIQGSPFAIFVHYPAYKLGPSLRTIPGASFPQVSRPLGISLCNCGSESRIVVCDSAGKGCVSVLSREGHRTQEILPRGTPHGVACGEDGSLYITLTDLHTIQKFTHEGVFVKGVAGKGAKPAQFKKPKGVEVSRGLVYVCDSGNSRVQIFDSDLNFVSSFGQKGSSPMSLTSPVDVAFDSSGHIYVADSLRNRVIQFSPKYLYVKTFGNERSASCKLNGPQSVCIGPNDIVYVTDCDHCVSVYQASGELLANFGGRGGEVGQFLHPCGIAVDDDGFVYVSDRDNGRIQVF